MYELRYINNAGTTSIVCGKPLATLDNCFANLINVWTKDQGRVAEWTAEQIAQMDHGIIRGMSCYFEDTKDTKVAIIFEK